MKKRLVKLSYSKKEKRFLYINNLIGGPHYVKDDIAVLIRKKLRIRSEKAMQHINVQRPGEIITYAVVVVA